MNCFCFFPEHPQEIPFQVARLCYVCVCCGMGWGASRVSVLDNNNDNNNKIYKEILKPNKKIS